MIDLSHRRKYISYEEAIKTFDENGLLLLLREGSMQAKGQLHNLYPLDYHPDDNTPLSHSLMAISKACLIIASSLLTVPGLTAFRRSSL